MLSKQAAVAVTVRALAQCVSWVTFGDGAGNPQVQVARPVFITAAAQGSLSEAHLRVDRIREPAELMEVNRHLCLQYGRDWVSKRAILFAFHSIHKLL